MIDRGLNTPKSDTNHVMQNLLLKVQFKLPSRDSFTWSSTAVLCSLEALRQFCVYHGSDIKFGVCRSGTTEISGF